MYIFKLIRKPQLASWFLFIDGILNCGFGLTWVSSQLIAEKVMYYSPNFDPMAFLSRVHHKTSAADLESGALVLKNDFKGRTQQKKQLVKENFDCFVSCKTTIDGRKRCYEF